MSGRFDPESGKPYGQCLDCSHVVETEDDSRQHLTETRATGPDGGASHRVRITNPSRANRIRNRVATIVDDAIGEAITDLDRLVERGDITEAEATEALRMWPDFADGWQEYVEGGAS